MRPPVFFTPEDFTAQEDSFRINIIVSNFGLVTEDSFSIKIRHQLPNGTIYEGHPVKRFPMVNYRDTLSYILKNPVGNELTGQNIFEITVDSKQEIEEYQEDNNQVRISKLVLGNVAAILFPTKYAVVGESSISLKASAFFMTADQNIPFAFEIDTTNQFNSPAMVSSGTVIGNATFAEWQLTF